MNRTLLGVLSIGMCIAMVGVALAQNPPPPQPEGGPGQGPGPGGFGQGGFTQPVQQPGEFNPRGGQGGFGRGGRGGGGGGGGRGGNNGDFNDRARGDRGPIQGPDVNKFEMLRGYIEVVDRYATMTRSADSAGVAAVISASDILRQRGPEAAADYLTKLLPEVKIPAIERAIRIQLADLYRQSGQGDKALEHLTVLMKASN